MTYKVINKFREKHDNNRVYNVGDPYPFNNEGYKPTNKRLDHLSKPNPDFEKVVFIEKVATEEPVEEKKKPKAKAKTEKNKG